MSDPEGSPLAAETAPADPERLGPYRLSHRLGQGGMGEVFLAWDERLDRPVAIKRIRAGSPATEAQRRRFRREARAVARLNHPAIVQIHDLFTDGSGDALVMEYLEGSPLSRLLAAGSLETAFALRLARQIADGLAAAHAAGIVHRDLKAANVFVTPEGQAKILDFGLARPLLPEGDEPLTGPGVVMGTHHAMSPEQVRGGPVDERSDLFSLGVLLYEMLTGISPFRGEDALATLRSVLEDEPRPLGDIRPDLPPAWGVLLSRLLAKDRAERPRDARAVVRALAAFDLPAAASAGGTVDDLSTGTSPLPTWAPAGRGLSSSALSPVRRSRFLRPGGLAAAVALLSVGAYLFVRPAPAPLRIAVPMPRIEGAAGGARLSLAAAGVLDALLGELAALEGLAPLDPSQLGKARTPREMAHAAAAGEVLSTVLEPEGDLARVSLRRIREDGRVLWSEEFRIPTAPGDLRLAADAVRVYLRRAYPEASRRAGSPDLDVDDGDYAEFLDIRRRMAGGPAAVAPELARLEPLARRSPRFLGAQLLGSQLALSSYQNTRQAAQLDQAERFLRQARRLAPEDPRPRLEELRLALARGRLAEAATRLEEIERLLPGDPEVLVLRGRLAEQQGRRPEAITHLRAAVARAPSWKNLLSLALVEYQDGQVGAARRHFQQLLERDPGNLWGLERLAEMELMVGEPARAATIYRRLLATTPQRPYYTNLGLALVLLGRPGEAVAAYREALRLGPGHTAVLLNLADALDALGQKSAARELYAQALAQLEDRQRQARLEPTEQMNRAQCLAHLDRTREAVEITQHTLQQHPNHPEVVYLAALVYALAGDRTSAVVNAKAALAGGTEPRWFGLAGFDAVRSDPELHAALAAARPPR